MSSPASTADVTIIVTPRERFSFAVESLESVIANTAKPYQLIYVDIGMSGAPRAGVERLCAEHGFTLIRTTHFVGPNHARNLALEEVRTRHVVFIENDVMVERGWLPALVACAEEAGAAMVMPLLCQGLPLHTVVHCAGGLCAIEEGVADGRPFRRYVEQIFDQRRSAAELRPTLQRRPTELAEVHCLLVRTDVLRSIGPLDERLLGTREHIDLCLRVQALGLPIMFEPAACATFADDAPLTLADLPYYMLRWSDEWERTSIAHWRRKWRVDVDDGLQLRMRNIGWRRRAYLLWPLVTRVVPGETPQRIAMRVLSIVERGVNTLFARGHGLLGRRDRPAARA